MREGEGSPQCPDAYNMAADARVSQQIYLLSFATSRNVIPCIRFHLLSDGTVGSESFETLRMDKVFFPFN